jgi:nucleoside-diphosphate-sugar epimerase
VDRTDAGAKAHTTVVDSEKKPVKVLVTGASGFIGEPVLARLVADSALEVLALGRSRPAVCEHEQMWAQWDLSSGEPLPSAVARFEPEAVVHLAWAAIPDFSPEQCARNLLAGMSLVDQLARLGTVRRVVASGSCFEYNPARGACVEGQPARPKDYFTWAKHALHQYLEVACRAAGVDLVWMRFFYVYGPRQREGSLIPTVLKALSEDRLPPIRTPHNANDFVYVDDVAEGVLRGLDSDVQPGIYNLGSGHATSVLEVCRIAERLTRGSSVLSDALGKGADEATSPSFWADLDRSRDLLRWAPAVPLGEGILRMVEHGR